MADDFPNDAGSLLKFAVYFGQDLEINEIFNDVNKDFTIDIFTSG